MWSGRKGRNLQIIGNNPLITCVTKCNYEIKCIFRSDVMYDLVFKGGTIIDGTGKKAYKADIGIIKDKIAFIGNINDDSNAIDITGKYITPGFIDTHSHADCSIFLYPDCESYLRQGITTFIGGQCGDSNAPIYNYWMRKYWEYDFWNEIDPFVYEPQTIQPVQKVLDVVYKRTGYQIEWKSFGEYRNTVEKIGLGCNMITLAGHSQIRADVMGLDEERKPTDQEMNKMKYHIDEAMASGTWGISTGRDYPPSAYADIEEILDLAEYVNKQGGYYFTHWKRTGIRLGTPKAPNKLDGIIEALEVALRTGIKTEISHLSTAFDIYPENPDMDKYAAEITLKIIDDYIDKGADVAFDVIPGTSGGIRTVPYLASNFMPWVKQSGSLNQFITNLKSNDYRKRLVKILNDGEWYSINPKSNPSWDKKIYISKCYNENYINKNINKISNEKNINSLNLIMDLLIEDPKTMIRTEGKSHEEIKGLLNHKRASVCTDTYAFDLKGLYGNDGEIAEILPHPHTYCAFPKYILQYGMDTIEETIFKITGSPAKFMNIKGRGEIKENNYADLVVFELENLKTNENYIEPRVYPQGISYVAVNGKIAVNSEGNTRIRAGKILTK